MKLVYSDLSSGTTKAHEPSSCVHCGEPCDNEQIIEDGLSFCCHGCVMIYKVLAHQKKGGGDIQIPDKEKWSFLNTSKIQDLLLKFKEDRHHKVYLDLPQVHCSSCIQILEKLPQLHSGILAARLNFPKKQLSLSFNPELITLRKVAELLDFVGYPPSIQLSSEGAQRLGSSNKKLLMQMGVAGFVFGNVMLMSFPAYFNLQDVLFERLFGYLSLALCIPLLTYSASDFLKSGYAGVINKSLNIDVPISIGALTLFLRSAYEILAHTGPGYLDSLSGFVFFLLIGKWIQQRTYESISFKRGYQHYFPLHATIKMGKNHVFKPLSDVKTGELLFIRNAELIPCDGLLLSDHAHVDYSFVTGEERPVHVGCGEKVFAGGKNVDGAIEVLTSQSVDQSYLTSLWEEDAFQSIKAIDSSSFINYVGKYFTITILGIAALTLIFWMYVDPSLAMNAFTSVLIIACPCVLALSTPFTYGTLRSLLSKTGIFFRNTQTLELLHTSKSVIFDKTGTLTTHHQSKVDFIGIPLNPDEREAICAIAQRSTHPLSQSVFNALGSDLNKEVERFQEFPGKGIQGWVDDHFVRIGSADFLEAQTNKEHGEGSTVYVEINGNTLGYFSITVPLRTGIRSMVDSLRSHFPMFLLSGDRKREASRMASELALPSENMHFEQSPFDKLQFIKELQSKGQKVLMIGDGLNDAGAFQQSDISAVVTEDLNNFTPASDIIIEAKELPKLPQLIQLSKDLKGVIRIMYAFAFLYNGIGLWFAIQGLLSPVVAAILMPISSVSIVLTGTLLTHWYYRKNMFA